MLPHCVLHKLRILLWTTYLFWSLVLALVLVKKMRRTGFLQPAQMCGCVNTSQQSQIVAFSQSFLLPIHAGLR